MADLRGAGILTDEEFGAKKKQLLGLQRRQETPTTLGISSRMAPGGRGRESPERYQSHDSRTPTISLVRTGARLAVSAIVRSL